MKELKSIFTLLSILFLTSSCQHKNVHSISDLNYINLFDSHVNSDVGCYRIPSMVTTTNGDLITAIDERHNTCGDLHLNDNINIVIRRSEDNGNTWSNSEKIIDYPDGESASDPSMIVDQITGTVFLFFNYMNLQKPPRQYFLKVIKSQDHGKSWSMPIDITQQISKPEWGKDFKFITSGRGAQTRSGKLIHTLVNLQNGLHIFGSENHGESWFLLDQAIIPGDESKVLELQNGDWMINSRVNKSGVRFVHRSDDQGKTWKSLADSTLIDPSCNASLVRYTSISDGFDKNRLLFSNANSTDERKNLTLRISYDEGKSWEYSRTIYSGKAAYSSLCVLQNGDIGVFFEKDDYKENVFVRVTLNWLTNGNDITPSKFAVSE